TARYDTTRMFIALLEALPYNELSEDDKLNYDLFLDGMKQHLDGQKFNFHYMPMGQQSGLHISFPQLIRVQPLNNPEEYRKYFARLRAFPDQVDNTIAVMRLGMQARMMPQKCIMEQTLPQIENVYKIDSPDKSIFY